MLHDRVLISTEDRKALRKSTKKRGNHPYPIKNYYLCSQPSRVHGVTTPLRRVTLPCHGTHEISERTSLWQKSLLWRTRKAV